LVRFAYTPSVFYRDTGEVLGFILFTIHKSGEVFKMNILFMADNIKNNYRCNNTFSIFNYYI